MVRKTWRRDAGVGPWMLRAEVGSQFKAPKQPSNVNASSHELEVLNSTTTRGIPPVPNTKWQTHLKTTQPKRASSNT